MNKVTLLIGVVAIAIGAIAGWLGSGMLSRQGPGQMQDARSDQLERRLTDLRTENDRIGAQLKNAQRQLDTTEADLRREKEMNARLHLLVSDGRK